MVRLRARKGKVEAIRMVRGIAVLTIGGTALALLGCLPILP